ncbi:MAG: amidase family protein [Alphaproteobacteria bacterium]|nr:amidase family protein [Alphaproteobacteria bacterium]
MSIGEIFDRHDAVGMAELVTKGEVSPLELTEEAIRRVERVNPLINAVTIEMFDHARERAKAGLPEGPFTGVPFVLKDLMGMYKGFPATNGSRLMKDFIAPFDNVFVQRLKAAGFNIIGKTNVPEGGYTVSTEPDLFGPTRNPWNPDHVAGGSSGGSGAAVAARAVPIGSANDGGGSIRIPASNNGLVGLKPTRGRITLAPELADAWNGCVVQGCVSLSVRDTAAFFDAVGGAQLGDPYPTPMPQTPYLEQLKTPPKQLKIGMMLDPPEGEVDPAVLDSLEQTAKLLEGLGHTVEDARIDYDHKAAAGSFGRMLMVQAAFEISMMEQAVGRKAGPDDLMPVTADMVAYGRSIAAVDYARDVETMRKCGRQIQQSCSRYDVWLTPVMLHRPRKIGYFSFRTNTMAEANRRAAADIPFTVLFNISGQPAISLPLSMSGDGLPVGVQLAGPYGGEGLLLQLARQIEEAQPWRDRVPEIHA